MSNFVHLHVHTDFSCLDGFGTISEYAKKAADNNMGYLCVTDHGMGAAYPRMIEECAKLKIKPIFGCEVYVNNYNHLISEFSTLSDEMKYNVRKNYHLLLIAKNNQGYENLVKLISESWINGFYYKPRVSLDTIKKYSEGLICTSACMASEICSLIRLKKYSEAIHLTKDFKDIFGDNFYLEIQMINVEEQDDLNKHIISMSKILDIPLVVTNDVHYCEKEHSYHQMIELLINSKGTINKPDGLEFHTKNLWYKTEQEMDDNWKENYSESISEETYKSAKENTYKICQMCDVQVDTSPKFPEIENSERIMMSCCLDSMKSMYLYDNKVYRDRLLKEFDVITDKGYASYFICVKKIIDYAKSIGASVGAGRGSGAGSLICYLLGITQVDPIKHDLLFERFLSPSRGGKFAKLQFLDSSRIES